MIANVILEFLNREDIQEALEKSNFDYVYSHLDHLSAESTSALTKLFYAAEVDPLQYIEDIPAFFLLKGDNREITLGPNVRYIGPMAFADCAKLEILNINSLQPIDMLGNSFFLCLRLKHVNYPGTWQQLRNQIPTFVRNTVFTSTIVHCRDADYRYDEESKSWQPV